MTQMRLIVLLLVVVTFGQAVEAQGLKVRTYRVMVNYDLPLGQFITGGNYNPTGALDELRRGDFPAANGLGRKDIELQMISFGRPLNYTQVLQEIDRMGLRPATLQELLAFGQIFHATGDTFIYELGTVRRPGGDRSHVGVVHMQLTPAYRELYVEYHDLSDPRDCFISDAWFAAVRK